MVSENDQLSQIRIEVQTVFGHFRFLPVYFIYNYRKLIGQNKIEFQERGWGDPKQIKTL
jgi:hypothetical protein